MTPPRNKSCFSYCAFDHSPKTAAGAVAFDGLRMKVAGMVKQANRAVGRPEFEFASELADEQIIEIAREAAAIRIEHR